MTKIFEAWALSSLGSLVFFVATCALFVAEPPRYSLRSASSRARCLDNLHATASSLDVDSPLCAQTLTPPIPAVLGLRHRQQPRGDVVGSDGRGSVSLALLLLRCRLAARNSRVPGNVSCSLTVLTELYGARYLL